MSIFGKSFKATVVYDETTGAPKSLKDVSSATMLDGAVQGLVGITNDTIVTGAAKTASIAVPLAIAVVGTSKMVSGNWLPSKL